MDKLTELEEAFSRKFPKLYATCEGLTLIGLGIFLFACYIVWGPQNY